MSKVAGFIIGGLEIIAGVILVATGVGATLGVGLIISGATMIVTQAIVDLTMPKTPARQASEMSVALGEQPRSAFFGEGFTAGSLVDVFNYGGKYGTDWEVQIVRLADHECEGLTSFLVNDINVNYTGDGAVSGYNGQLEIYFRSDTTTQALPAVVTRYGPKWSSGDRGESGCDVVVAYKADEPDAENPVWTGGRPRFGFVLKGKLCYDPRKDSTVTGGSGTHRWDDPTTWEWSENPAVCRYNWARGIYANDDVDDPSALLVGRGLSAAEAPPENIFAAANLCDEDPGDGSAVRYRVAGPVYANQEHLEVEQMFALACAGTVVTREGSVELEPGQAKSITMTFTDDDIVVGTKVSWNHRILSESNAEWVNTVVARYVEPTQKWNDFAAPVVRSIADIFADGKPREATITLRLVKDQKQALRIAEIQRRLGRLWGRGQVTLGPRFCETEEGDWVQWQSDRFGFTITFRVEAYQIDEKWQNTLTLREISSTVFGDGTEDATTVEWSIVGVVDLSAVTNATKDEAAALAGIGKTLNGFDQTDQVRLSLPTGQTYVASLNDRYFGFYSSGFRVIKDGDTGSPYDWTSGPFSTAEAARAAFPGVTLTGAESYTFHIWDDVLGDNSGGVSIMVERGRVTSLPDNSEVNPTDPPPAIGAPDVANWSLAAVTLANGGVSVPALEITGDASDDTTAEAIVFEYWKADGVIDPVANPDAPTWTVYAALTRSTTKVDITGIEGGQDYYAAVTYIVSGIRGSRLVLGPVTATSIDVSGAIDGAASAALTASEAIAAGDFVNIYSSSGAKVRKANATDDTKPVNAFAQSAIASGAAGSVRGAGGKISVLSGLTPGATYYLATTGGAITTTPPSGSGNLVQEIGVAVSATELLFNPRVGVTVS
jgi:hypothetical protein